jgi:hypothetical protein
MDINWPDEVRIIIVIVSALELGTWPSRMRF